MGTLYVVATPIGNLKDITQRAVEVLGSVDAIFCEDTRVTSKLSARFGFSAPLRSFFAGNEDRRVEEVCEVLAMGKSVALVTDAGTPGISDPGFLLVKACRERGIPVVPVPGPSALTAALSVSGLPSDRVLFLGFPPRRAGERGRLLDDLREDPATLVFYEAPHRFKAFLQEARERLPGRECVVARELTKAFETVSPVEGDAAEAIPEKGEFVVMFGPPKKQVETLGPEEAAERVRRLVDGGLDEKDAMRRTAKAAGLSRRDLYAMLKVKKP